METGSFSDDGGLIRELAAADRIFPADWLDLVSLEEWGGNFADIVVGLLKAVQVQDGADQFTCQISGREGQALLVTVMIVEVEGIKRGMVVRVSIHHGGW